MYRCSECGTICPDPIKACKCDAPIIAEMSATIAGKGGLQVSKDNNDHSKRT